MNFKKYLSISIITSILFLGCEEQPLIPVSNLTPPTVALETPTVSANTVEVLLSGSYKCQNQSVKISDCGFYYYLNSNKDDVNRVPATSTESPFSAGVMLKEYGSTYTYKAYVSNGQNEITSDEASITVKNFADFVSIDSPKIVTSNGSSLIVKTKVKVAEGVFPTEKGICYGTSNVLSIDSAHVATDAKTDEYSVTLTELAIGQEYYMCSYVREGAFIAYGAAVSFKPHTIPSLSTKQVSDIDYFSALSGGYNVDENGLEITSKGVVWSTQPNPTVQLTSKTADGNGNADFTSQLGNLQPGTKYYVRAYATNSDGTGYGEELSFTTTSLANATVSTNEVTSITASSAISSGTISADGGAAVTARGLVWSTSHNPTVELETKTVEGNGIGEFTSSISNLQPGTTYYVRAYATNSVGTAYGAEKSFTTLAETPIVSTLTVTEIAETSAKFHGNVTSAGGASVSERGFVWSTTQNPTLENSKKECGNGLGEFSITVSDLSIATTYYVRAYATNSAGTAYGNQVIFSTEAVIPVLTTLNVSSVTGFTAESGGNITFDGGSTVKARGVVWSTEHDPTIDLSTKTSDGTGDGEFSSNMTGLKPGMTYYVRAYATNSIGTGYGTEKSFTTKTVAPSLTTSDATEITSTSAKLGGNVTDNGGADVTERGVVWSTTQNPTIYDYKQVSGSGLGGFAETITGLSIATTYYVRAYATNEAGTAYGNQIIFSTGSVIPIITTSAITNITGTTATAGGNITFNGGSTILAKGIVWSKEKNPTIEMTTKTVSTDSSTGSFSGDMTNLEPGTKYYVRAYATNSIGTAYGEEIEFTTNVILATITIQPISDISKNTAKATAQISFNGGGTVSERGFVWNTLESPTTNLGTKLTDESGNDSYIGTITGLTPNTTYYVRAYAVNEAGTSYSNQVSFRTNADGNTEDVGNSEYEW